MNPAPSQPAPISRWVREAGKFAGFFQEFHIPARFHAAFAEFIETGDVRENSPDFLQALERDRSCQQAVEKAFRLRLAGLPAAVQALKE
jgi:hypothetical protein